jgi:DNA-binding transcriptional LysR family regulator
VRLLDRSSRGIEPTIYAHALLKRGNVVFDELRQGIRDIEFLANPTAGEVRIASGETVASGLLPAAIDRLSRRYPDITVHVDQADTTTLEFRELRAEGRHDSDANEPVFCCRRPRYGNSL